MIGTGIKVIVASSKQNFDSLQSYEREIFPSHIGRIDLRSSATYLLLLDPEDLYFSVKIPESNNFDRTGNYGQFKPDLWKHDVAELFIAADTGNSYQEFNLAPSGAYWTVKFSGYRERIPESDAAVANLQIECRTTITGKVLSMKIPRSHIIENCSLGENSRINCCAIFDKDPRNYFSTATLNPEKPDFHEISQWAKTKLISVSPDLA